MRSQYTLCAHIHACPEVRNLGSRIEDSDTQPEGSITIMQEHILGGGSDETDWINLCSFTNHYEKFKHEPRTNPKTDARTYVLSASTATYVFRIMVDPTPELKRPIHTEYLPHTFQYREGPELSFRSKLTVKQCNYGFPVPD